MKRKWSRVLTILALVAPTGCRFAFHPPEPPGPPNIVYILADDLGYGEVGAYGQTKIRTPNIDRLAQEGMRFTQHYSGSPVCAPARCVLLTGLDTGRCQVRGNYEMGKFEPGAKEGQWPLDPGTRTLGVVLQEAGYTTAATGKWGLGGPDSTGRPNLQGFDLFYGYLCQRVAHNYYPPHLWRNEEKHLLDNPVFAAHQTLEGDPDDPASYVGFSGNEYAQDLIAREALQFIRDNHQKPFFLYVPFTVPHVSLQVPEDSLQEYADSFPETPYKGERGYLPHPKPRAAYAAMVTRMDRQIGDILDVLDDLGLADNTLVIFSSDNGPTFNGGSDSEFFQSAGPLRGLKASVYEGGIRVPMVARWPGKIPAGSVTDHVSGFQDVLPTLAQAAGAPVPEGLDGVSFLPTLMGKASQAEHESLYWELGRQQAARMGPWKAVRMWNQEKTEAAPIQLYNLERDLGETRDVAREFPEIVERAEQVMESRTSAQLERWNFGPVEGDPEAATGDRD